MLIASGSSKNRQENANFPKFYSAFIICTMLIVDRIYTRNFASPKFLKIDRVTTFKFNYFVNYPDVNYSISFDAPDTSKCEPCNFTSVNYGADGNKHDVLAAKNSGNPNNMIIFLRSLRQSGSKCQVVFFVTDEAMSRMSNDTLKYAQQCGAQFINYHKSTSKYFVDSYSEPYFHMYRFLQLHKHEINRFIQIDLYDTFFQGDPFNDYLPKNALHVVDEGSVWDIWNTKWIASCGGKYSDKRKTICGGYFGGDAEHVFNFLRVYTTNFVFHINMNDQGCLNHWVHSGFFENNGVPINRTENNIVLHMYTLGMSRNQTLGNITAFYRSDLVAAILHQTHWHCSLIHMIREKCPPPPGNFSHYQSKCKG